jgi:hypothetical protein
MSIYINSMNAKTKQKSFRSIVQVQKKAYDWFQKEKTPKSLFICDVDFFHNIILQTLHLMFILTMKQM